LNLTPDQVAAAKAIGCAFFPATEMQVQRLTMQQRVFRVDGKPFLLSRDGSYYETAGTLRALIANVLPEQTESPAAAPTPIPEETAAEPPPAGEPTPEPAPPEPAQPETASPQPAAPAAPRKRGRPRKAVAPPAAVQAEPEPEAAPKPVPEAVPEPPAPESPPPVAPAAPAPDTGARSDRLARLARRRAGAPLPKWRTAGPARRGRLKRS
jgi:outer membrane biosynthesis protein TonB